jgi:hypothetical protein
MRGYAERVADRKLTDSQPGGGDDVLLADLPRPPVSRVIVEDGGQHVTVRYPLSARLVVWLAAALAALAVPVLAFGIEWDPAGAEALRAAATGWKATLLGWIQGAPRVWAGVFTLIGGFLLSAVLRSPRSVRVAADAVFVLRGLWPWPRRYPRSRDSRMVQTDGLVTLVRGDRVTPFNPSLAPVLTSVPEARWVAAVLRAAMRRTADERSTG